MNDEWDILVQSLTKELVEPPRDASLWAKARYELALWRRPWWEISHAEAVERRIVGKIGDYLRRAALLYAGYLGGRWIRWTPPLVLGVERALWAGLAVLVFVLLWHLLGLGGVFGGLKDLVNPIRKFRQYRRWRSIRAYRLPPEDDPFGDDA